MDSQMEERGLGHVLSRLRRSNGASIPLVGGNVRSTSTHERRLISLIATNRLVDVSENLSSQLARPANDNFSTAMEANSG